MDADEFRTHGHELIDWIADYIEGVERLPVAPAVAPGRRPGARCPSTRRPSPSRSSDVLADLDGVIVPGLTHWQHPSFFAYFPAQHVVPVDPRRAAGRRARRAGHELGHQPGLHRGRDADARLDARAARPARRASARTSETGGGVIQGSASEADAGGRSSPPAGGRPAAPSTPTATRRSLVAYATSQAHSSIEKGLRIAGIGTDQLRIVAPRRRRSPCGPAALAADGRRRRGRRAGRRSSCARRGARPVSMAFDPTPAIADVCRDGTACGCTSTRR